MRTLLWGLAGLVVVVLGVLGAVLAFNAPVQPPPLASVSDPFAGVNFSDLPAVQTYPARDGVKLGYRVYAGGGAHTVVLIHGSSDDGSGMHVLAKALRDAGASVYVPVRARPSATPAAAATSTISASSETISPISWRCFDRFVSTPAFR